MSLIKGLISLETKRKTEAGEGGSGEKMQNGEGIPFPFSQFSSLFLLPLPRQFLTPATQASLRLCSHYTGKLFVPTGKPI